MRRLVVAALLAICGRSGAQDALSDDVLKRLKEATVFVRCEIGDVYCTGTGFLVRASGGTGYIVTNHHVIEEPELPPAANRGPAPAGPPIRPGLPRPGIPKNPGPAIPRPGQPNPFPRVPIPNAPMPQPGPGFIPNMPGRGNSDNFRDTWKVYAIFNSGLPNEKKVRARLVAADMARDLAVLRVESADLPEPVDYRQAATPAETQTIYIFGFPFGEALATSGKFPAITIGKGTVSSLRLNDKGQLGLVQIDGDINPGNSGGPVVDTKGKLVGVSVARVKDSRIGFAIPPSDVDSVLAPSVGLWRISEISANKEQPLGIDIDARTFDPDKKIRSAKFQFAPMYELPNADKFKKDGLSGLPGAQTTDVEIADGRIKFRKNVTDTTPDRLMLVMGQFIVETDSGQTLKSTIKGVAIEPRIRAVARGPEPIPATPRPKVPTAPIPEPKPKDPDLTRPSSKMPEPAPAPKREPTAVPGPESLPIPVVAPAKRIVHGAFSQTAGVKDRRTIQVDHGIPCLFFDDDPDFFFVLEKSGTLIRVNSSDLTIDKEANFKNPCGWLSPAHNGLVLSLTGRGEVWLLDKKTWKVTRTFSVPGLRRAVSSPQSSMAYAEGRDGNLHILHLPAGTTKVIEANQFAPNVGFESLTLSPDGQYLFVLAKPNTLCRYRVKDDSIEPVDSIPFVRRAGPTDIIVSDDSNQVCALSIYGLTTTVENAKRTARGSTYVFRTNDLTKPALIMESGFPLALAFDARLQHIVVQTRPSPVANPVTIFDADGQKVSRFELTTANSSPRPANQLLVRKTDGRILLMAGDRITSLELR